LKNNYLYQGAYSELDEDIGWNDFALRNYDAQIGRWVQQDPYQQFATPYSYVGGDPVNYIDPSGGIGLACPGTSGLAIFLDKVFYSVTNFLSKNASLLNKFSLAASIGKAGVLVTQAIDVSNTINGGISSVQVGMSTSGSSKSGLGNRSSQNGNNGVSSTQEMLDMPSQKEVVAPDEEDLPVIKFAIEATFTDSKPSDRGAAHDLARVYIFGEFDSGMGTGYINISVPSADAVFRFDISNSTVSKSSLFLDSNSDEDDISLLEVMGLNPYVESSIQQGIVKEARGYYDKLQQHIKKEYQGASETFGIAKSKAKKKLNKISEDLKGKQQELMNIFRTQMENFWVRHYYTGWDVATPTRVYFKGGRFYFTTYPFYIIEAGIEIIYRVK
jgi:RHS repeat-associated protein